MANYLEKTLNLKFLVKYPIRNAILSSVTIVSLILLVYHRSLSHEFQMKWDDQWVVINHYTENGFTMVNIWSILTEFYHGQYAPLNQLSYTTLYHFFNYDPYWFHFLGLTVHTANVMLIFLLVKKVMKSSRVFDGKSMLNIPFITAILMAIHPFLVESVAWISASKILIYSFFYLISLIFYLNFQDTRERKYYLLILFGYFLSFGGKEQAVTLPVCLLLFDFVLGRNFNDKKIWLEKLPFFILSLVFGYITLISQSSNGAGLLSKTEYYPYHHNLLFACYSIIEYFVKCIIPINLLYLYPFPNAMGDPIPIRFWIYPILLIFISYYVWSIRSRKWIIFGLIFFLIHLMVAIHIIPIARFAIVADRYVYISSIGIFFIMAYLFDRGLTLLKYRNVLKILLMIYVIALASYSRHHLKVWANSEVLKKELNYLLNQRNQFQKR